MRDTEGSYSGIGVSITQNSEGGILVVDCYEGGPANSSPGRYAGMITSTFSIAAFLLAFKKGTIPSRMVPEFFLYNDVTSRYLFF